MRERLELFVEAAKGRGDVLDHVLLSGPPGLGKTTLAYILAEAMGANIKATSGPVIDKPGDLAGLLTSLERGDVLFIDEIHRMQKAVEEYLYSAMEDFVIDIMIDQGPHARSRPAEPAALHADRRDDAQRLADRAVAVALRPDQPAGLLRRRGSCKSIIDAVGAHPERGHGRRRRARKSPGAPAARRASRTACCAGSATTRRSRPATRSPSDVADKALAMLDIDEHGLDEMDKRILETIIQKFGGGPVGLNSLAVSVGEEADTIEEVYEPYLIRKAISSARRRAAWPPTAPMPSSA